MRKWNRDSGIMEKSNIKDAEFKTPVIKMPNGLRERLDELSENFDKEKQNIKMKIEIIKGDQSEMKINDLR